MYPRYYKQTKTATACFKTIGELCEAKSLMKISVDLKDVTGSLVYDTLSNDFSFEVFSPHYDDMTTSNNSSIVCKVNGATGSMPSSPTAATPGPTR